MYDVHEYNSCEFCIHNNQAHTQLQKADPISYWRQQASLKSVTGDNSLCTGVPAQRNISKCIHT